MAQTKFSVPCMSRGLATTQVLLACFVFLQACKLKLHLCHHKGEKRCKSGSQRVQKYVKVIAKEYNIWGNFRGVTSGNQQRGGQVLFLTPLICVLFSYQSCQPTNKQPQRNIWKDVLLRGDYIETCIDM